MKREYFKIESLSIQILQYEFLGPIPLEEWGPPMEKLVYLILSRSKDKFDMLYVGDCKKTNEPSFFTQHSRYKCWTENFGSGRSLYLAVLPLFESSDVYRENVVNKIIRQYKPFCNPESTLKAKSDYVIKTSKKIDDTNTDDTNTDDTNTDDTNTDDTNTDDTNTDDTNTDDTNTDDTNTDDTNTDDTNTDDTNTDDTNTDDTNTDDTNTDDTNTDDTNTDDTNTDDTNTDDTNTDDTNTDDTNTDDTNTDDTNTDDTNTDDTNTDDTNTDDTNTNDQSKKFVCPCCGSEMKYEKTLQNSTLYRCASCGLSDTRIDC